MFDHWLSNHQKLGGFLATSYVDWGILHSPMHDIVRKLEEYRQLPFESVMSFADADLIDNNMEYRDILEDVSKLFFLTEAIQYDELTYNPQILHEPWHNRYRVHPGSGRLMALWLCGYETLKTIYIHFDEPEFIPPGDCFLINDRRTAQSEFHVNPFAKFNKLEIETYAAFPKLDADCIKTQHYDREWDWTKTNTSKPWQFMRFSEGDAFLEYKNQWRSYAIDAWQDMQQDHVQLGSTEFSFNNKGKVVEVIRNTGNGPNSTIIMPG